jgi:hypothetical protein
VQSFIGLDGEGVDSRYVLLQDSQGGELCNLRGLSTKTVFNWLLDRAEALDDLNPAFVGFVTTYDVNMILKDVDDETLERAFQRDDKDFVTWGEYEFLYIPRRIFKLRSQGRSFTLFDVFGFFGTSFVKACESMLGEAMPRLITQGKADRSTFKASDLPRIKRYNAAECQYLVRLCERLRDILESQSIHLTKWHGPGAVADHVLGKRGINLHTEYPNFQEDAVPRGLLEAWDCAYYGGRFETMGIGTYRNVQSYDINSAYPYALSGLSALTYAQKWQRHLSPTGPNHGQNAVYLVSWDVNHGTPFGPFPWRGKQKKIYYPLNGIGWYWSHEVKAAIQSFGAQIKLHEGWSQPEGEPSILQKEIPRLYDLRKALKRKKDRGEYALKIALNSIYGKLAQRVGRASFRCMPWAGQITSQTRAQLLSAVRGREGSVLAFATDGIVTTDPLPLKDSENLGGWKAEKHKDFLVLMSGVYRQDGKTAIEKSAVRGLGKDINWSEVIAALNSRQIYEYRQKVFVTHSLAIHNHLAYGPHRLKFIDTSKRLSPFDSTRRHFESRRLAQWDRESIKSNPVRFDRKELSYPSSLDSASVEIEEDDE